MNNKRKYTRIKYTTDVRINLLDRTDMIACEGKAIDISGNGILVRLNRSLSVGVGIDMLFMKPNSFNTFSCMGKVVRTIRAGIEEYTIGINFSNLSHDEEKNLDYYLTRHSPL